MTDNADPTPDADPKRIGFADDSQGDRQGLTFTLPGNVVVGSGEAPDSGRPGGPSLADQVATLSQRLDEALEDRDGKIQSRSKAKNDATEADERVSALQRQVEALTQEQARNRVAELASEAKAIDPFLVAKVVGDAEDPAAAIKAMTQSHPEMFGKGQTRRAGTDMTNGGGTTGVDGPQTDIGKWLADRFPK